MHQLLHQRTRLLARCHGNAQAQHTVLEACRRDIRQWFALLAWTFDPRTSEHNTNGCLPFALYPFQEAALTQIITAIETGNDCLIEKSRDMGISWLIVHIFLYYWRFHSGSHFLIGSRRQDSVDTKADLSSLMEKLRFAVSMLPTWARPEGFNLKQHAPLLRLINPDNSNTIVGESSNPQFSRGGRYKAILMDEFPFWPNDDSAFAAAGQSSPCRLVVGTPYGKHNAFARLRFGGNMDVLTLHWRQHPSKDESWYARQTQRMSANECARELDINYNLSVSNRVFTDFGPQHVADRLDVLPNRRILRTWDFGYHCPAVVLCQIDDSGCVRVLREITGHQTVLATFSRHVLDLCDAHYPHETFEDLCDPAGSQKSDKGDQTSIDILNSLGIYPFYQRSRILRGIELIRAKLLGTPQENGPSNVQLLLDRRYCPQLIDAFEGGYRYANDASELPREEHPYEDVMDCLRYAITYKCDFSDGNALHRQPKSHRPKPGNPYTGY